MEVLMKIGICISSPHKKREIKRGKRERDSFMTNSITKRISPKEIEFNGLNEVNKFLFFEAPLASCGKHRARTYHEN